MQSCIRSHPAIIRSYLCNNRFGRLFLHPDSPVFYTFAGPLGIIHNPDKPIEANMKNFIRLFAGLLSLLFSLHIQAQPWVPFSPKPTSNVLWDVYATDANNAWAVGNNATVLQWNGSAWISHTIQAGFTSQRFGVWASSASDVYVVGISTGNQIHHYDGSSWTNIGTSVNWGTGSIRSVWGSSANDVWITGTNGRVFRMQNNSWSSKSSGVPATLSGLRIWGTDAGNIWLIGSTGASNTGTILKWNEGSQSWDTQASGLAAIKGIWGSGPSAMWAAGGNGAAQQGKIYRLIGATWTDASPAGSYASFYHIGGSNAYNIWAVGYNGLMYKYNGSSWAAESAFVTTDINAVAAGASGTTGSRLWTAGYGDATVNPLYTTVQGVLPLTWQSFTAHSSGNAVILNWTTATEQNTRSFEVEHSTGNNRWTAIATLPAAGNSNQLTHYTNTHFQPQPGDNYYRIRQADLDGQSSYSKTLVVRTDNAGAALRLLNNPVKNKMAELNINSKQLVKVIDMQGRELKRQTLAAGYQTIDLGGLAPGIYILAGEKDRISFIVQ